jgi:biopolymer transport protein ExbD
MIPGQEMPVMIASDKGIAYGEVVKVIDLLGSMGLHKISLDTKHVGGKR